VNLHDGEPAEVQETFRIKTEVDEEQCARLAAVRAARDAGAVEEALTAVTAAAQAGENSIPALIAAARARASVGEMTGALAEVHGRFSPSAGHLRV
jgi:methylmalonyl-CoA mutase N-terminal domain/subunit